jgi:uncharacterized membrane protein
MYENLDMDAVGFWILVAILALLVLVVMILLGIYGLMQEFIAGIKQQHCREEPSKKEE